MDAVDVPRTAGQLRLVIGQFVRRVRTEDHLAPRLAAVLGYLDRTGPMTTSELAVAADMRPQSMAHTVAELVALGYVERRTHPSDGRKMPLELTDSGRAVLTEEREGRAGWLAEAIAQRLSSDEQATLAQSVELLARLIRE